MFKELITYETEQEKLENRNDMLEKTSSRAKSEGLKFQAILCPKSANPISTNECSKCAQKVEYHRSHKLGISLSSMICTFEE